MTDINRSVNTNYGYDLVNIINIIKDQFEWFIPCQLLLFFSLTSKNSCETQQRVLKISIFIHLIQEFIKIRTVVAGKIILLRRNLLGFPAPLFHPFFVFWQLHSPEFARIKLLSPATYLSC